MNCIICKRPLTDLTSIQMGMGPVCRANHSILKGRKSKSKQEEFIFDNHAVYSIENETDTFVYIRDCGNHSKCKTVTNDIEWVVTDLDDSIENLENKRIFYMDSEGQIDEVIHNGKTFVSFKAGHAGVEL